MESSGVVAQVANSRVIINRSGILGERYIGFDVGHDTAMLKDGDMVKKESTAVLEQRINQFMFNKAQEEGRK